MDTYVGSEHTRLVLQLALTFVRTSELIGASWSKIDTEAAWWISPPERMKMKTPHIAPLSKQPQAVLTKLRETSFSDELIFLGDANSTKPMSNNTRLFALLALKRTVAELGAIGRNPNQIARAANLGERADGRSPHDVQLMLRLCGAPRDHVKVSLLANLRSW